MQLYVDEDCQSAFINGVFNATEFANLMDSVLLSYTVWIDPAVSEGDLAWTKRLVQYDIRKVWVPVKRANGIMVNEQQEKWFQYLLPLPEGTQRPIYTAPPVVKPATPLT